MLSFCEGKIVRKTKEEAEKTRLTLLASAVRLFEAKGVSATSLHDIAAQARMTRGALYWHFNCKEDIIRGIWETYAAPRLTPLFGKIRALRNGFAMSDFENILREILALFVRDSEVGLSLRILLHNVETIDCNVAIRHFFRQLRNEIREDFTRVFILMQEMGRLRASVDPVKAAMGLIVFMSGILDQHFLVANDVDIDRDGAEFLDTYLYGVMAPA